METGARGIYGKLSKIAFKLIELKKAVPDLRGVAQLIKSKIPLSYSGFF